MKPYSFRVKLYWYDGAGKLRDVITTLTIHAPSKRVARAILMHYSITPRG